MKVEKSSFSIKRIEETRQREESIVQKSNEIAKTPISYGQLQLHGRWATMLQPSGLMPKKHAAYDLL